MLEFFDRAAPFFGDVCGEFDAIQAEVGTVEQTQFFADEQDIDEDGLDLGVHGRDKVGNGTVIWGKAIREGDEDNVFVAGAFDLS